MSKRSLILLCCSLALFVAFLAAVMQFEKNVRQQEQNAHAAATAYVPTTTVPPTTEATKPTEPPVVAAPEFVIADKDNRTYGILNFKGKPGILCFWKTGAEEELDRMQELYDLYSEQANFIMIHLTSENETQEEALEFLAEKDYTFPVYFDTLGSAAKAYKISESPTSYFMTADNVLKAISKGPFDASELPKVLESIGLTVTAE